MLQYGRIGRQCTTRDAALVGSALYTSRLIRQVCLWQNPWTAASPGSATTLYAPTLKRQRVCTV